MKSKAVPPPARFDFVVLTVNDVETAEARYVFDQNDGQSGRLYSHKEGGLNYQWGFIPRKLGLKATVALVSFNDKQGSAEAITRTNDILEVLKPQFILVLGTAGGLKQNEEELQTGDVIVSYLVQYGTFKDANRTTHRGLPVMPPNAELYDEAAEIAKFDWHKGIAKDKRPTEGTSDVIFKEIASTDLLLANLDQPILQHFIKNCPRIAAVEMEAGGVAMQLFNALKDDRVPGYLVIKGISDIADADRETDLEGKPPKQTNQQERDLWRKYASHVSAVFAHSLITNFDPKRRWPTSLKRLEPPSLRQSLAINSDCAGVFYKVTPEMYSEFTAHNLERMSAHSEPKDNLFFTLSVLDPQRLWEVIQRAYNNKKYREPASPVPYSQLKTWALASFRHFKMFQKFASQADLRNRCVRILLLEDFDNWSNNLTKDAWNLLKAINGDVPCWAVERSYLRGMSPFISEYVIICERLVFDYYEESSVLIVTELFDEAIKRDFLWLKSAFDEARRDDVVGYPFKSFEDLDKEAMAKLGTEKSSQA